MYMREKLGQVGIRILITSFLLRLAVSAVGATTARISITLLFLSLCSQRGSPWNHDRGRALHIRLVICRYEEPGRLGAPEPRVTSSLLDTELSARLLAQPLACFYCTGAGRDSAARNRNGKEQEASWESTHLTGLNGAGLIGPRGFLLPETPARRAGWEGRAPTICSLQSILDLIRGLFISSEVAGI